MRYVDRAFRVQEAQRGCGAAQAAVHRRCPVIGCQRRRVPYGVPEIRTQKVRLDSDLAQLYGVTTKRLNEQVGRNRGRFPVVFMFRLTKEEAARLRSQAATSKEMAWRS